MYSSFTDAPTKKDLFKIENYIEGLSSFIINCDTPLTIAIQGDWGTGKTSIMEQVEEKLDKRRIKTIRFNTWQYSQFNMEKELAVSLIIDLICELEPTKEAKKKIFQTVKGVIPKALGYINPLAGKLTTDMVEAISEKWFSSSEDIKELKGNFQELINNAVGEKGKVVIFIDDLDRLVPARAVELLEVLKLFLDCEGCVFVLAIDYNVVVRGVREKYGDDFDEEKGKSFFDKIIQVPFSVPIAKYDISNFIGDRLKKLNYEGADSINIATNLIQSSIGNNPRSINRLFNSLILLFNISQRKQKNEDKLLLLALVCMELRYDYAYTYILEYYDEEDENTAIISELETAFKDNEAVFEYIGLDGKEIEKERKSFKKFYLEIKRVFRKEGKLHLSEKDMTKLVNTMKLSDTVATGNLKAKTQNHEPNEDVQFVIRKLFSRFSAGDGIDCSNPSHFGKESKVEREDDLSEEFKSISPLFDSIRLTQGKGQGIQIYHHNQENPSERNPNIYLSGDTYGTLINDGIISGYNNENKIHFRKRDFSETDAKNIRENEGLYEKFEKEVLEKIKEIMEILNKRAEKESHHEN